MRLLNGDRKITNEIKHQFEEEYCISTKDMFLKKLIFVFFFFVKNSIFFMFLDCFDVLILKIFF
jgi:hypothetical protein